MVVLPAPAACNCHKTPSQILATLGAFPLDGLEHPERGVSNVFWVHRFRCVTGATGWLVLEEGRIDDV